MVGWADRIPWREVCDFDAAPAVSARVHPLHERIAIHPVTSPETTPGGVACFAGERLL